MRTYRDARLPTDEQREALSRLAYLAFVDVRALCLAGKGAQVKDLVDAVHNLPLMMWHPEFSMTCQRDFFSRYLEKHGVREGFDYLAELDKIAVMKE